MSDCVQTVLFIDSTTERLRNTPDAGRQASIFAALERARSAPIDLSVLAAMMRLGDAAAVAAYLALPTTRAQLRASLWDHPFKGEFCRTLFGAAETGRLDILDAIIDAGLHFGALDGGLLGSLQDGLLKGMAHHRNPDVLPWIETRLARGQLGAREIARLVENCGTGIDACHAAEIAAVITRQAERGILATETLHSALHHDNDKLFYVLLRSGPKTVDISTLRSDYFFSMPLDDEIAERRLAIAEMATSAHGRLELRRREPCLEAMVARPIGGAFFAA